MCRFQLWIIIYASLSYAVVQEFLVCGQRIALVTILCDAGGATIDRQRGVVLSCPNGVAKNSVGIMFAPVLALASGHENGVAIVTDVRLPLATQGAVPSIHVVGASTSSALFTGLCMRVACAFVICAE